MSLKHIPSFFFLLIFLSACSRKVEVREYVEVVQLPPQSRPQMASQSQDPMRAGPLSVAPTLENLPADHPTLDGMHPPVAGGGAGPNMMMGRESEVPPAPEVTGLSWTVPAGWTHKNGGGMRLAEFYPDPENAAAVVTLIPLSGSAGSMDANIARWRGQVGLDPSQKVPLQHIDGKMHFEYITFLDESQKGQQAQTIIAAIYQQPQRTLFLKFMGPTETVASFESDFLKLAASLDQQEGAQ
ncbi:hypothetical protein P0Y35_01685 [Kiritimatiellaeota bacterium B1221]|nr:hypothetical protein [Kiritimatiellaeota bacterium B1221]